MVDENVLISFHDRFLCQLRHCHEKIWKIEFSGTSPQKKTARFGVESKEHTSTSKTKWTTNKSRKAASIPQQNQNTTQIFVLFYAWSYFIFHRRLRWTKFVSQLSKKIANPEIFLFLKNSNKKKKRVSIYCISRN